MTELPRAKQIETRIPARLGRLPWNRWHLLVVTALGITWLLDGLEVTLGVKAERQSLESLAPPLSLSEVTPCRSGSRTP
jgi:hypothetical protein